MFSLEQVQKGGAVFDIEKLKWLNKEHRKLLPEDEQNAYILSSLAPYPALQTILSQAPTALEDLRDRYTTTHELVDAIEAGEYNFFTTKPELTTEKLLWRKDPSKENTLTRLTHVSTLLTAVPPEHFSHDAVEACLDTYAEAEGKGNVLWPLRYALSGVDRSPNPYVLLEALGKEESLQRIQTAQELLQ